MRNFLFDIAILFAGMVIGMLMRPDDLAHKKVVVTCEDGYYRVIGDNISGVRIQDTQDNYLTCGK